MVCLGLKPSLANPLSNGGTQIVFDFKWAIPGHFFFYFRLFNTVDSR